MAGKEFNPDENEYPVDVPAELTPTEQKRIDGFNVTLRKNLASFVETGQIFVAIKEEKLYRPYPTFEDWLKAEHDISHSYGWRFMESSRVVARLETLPMGKVPASERQCRELFNVPDEDQAEVWQGVLDLAESEDVQVTSTLIRKYVKEAYAEDEKEGEEEVTDDSVRAGILASDRASAAIDSLKKIRANNPHRTSALNRVRRYINNSLRPQ